MRRSRSLSPARCRARCLVGVSCRVCGLNGVVSYKACHRCTMSPCPVVGEIPVEAVVSPVVPVAEASFNLSGPAGQ